MEESGGVVGVGEVEGGDSDPTDNPPGCRMYRERMYQNGKAFNNLRNEQDVRGKGNVEKCTERRLCRDCLERSTGMADVVCGCDCGSRKDTIEVSEAAGGREGEWFSGSEKMGRVGVRIPKQGCRISINQNDREVARHWRPAPTAECSDSKTNKEEEKNCDEQKEKECAQERGRENEECEKDQKVCAQEPKMDKAQYKSNKIAQIIGTCEGHSESASSPETGQACVCGGSRRDVGEMAHAFGNPKGTYIATVPTKTGDVCSFGLSDSRREGGCVHEVSDGAENVETKRHAAKVPHVARSHEGDGGGDYGTGSMYETNFTGGCGRGCSDVPRTVIAAGTSRGGEIKDTSNREESLVTPSLLLGAESFGFGKVSGHGPVCHQRGFSSSQNLQRENDVGKNPIFVSSQYQWRQHEDASQRIMGTEKEKEAQRTDFWRRENSRHRNCIKNGEPSIGCQVSEERGLAVAGTDGIIRVPDAHIASYLSRNAGALFGLQRQELTIGTRDECNSPELKCLLLMLEKVQGCPLDHTAVKINLKPRKYRWLAAKKFQISQPEVVATIDLTVHAKKVPKVMLQHFDSLISQKWSFIWIFAQQFFIPGHTVDFIIRQKDLYRRINEATDLSMDDIGKLLEGDLIKKHPNQAKEEGLDLKVFCVREEHKNRKRMVTWTRSVNDYFPTVFSAKLPSMVEQRGALRFRYALVFDVQFQYGHLQIDQQLAMELAFSHSGIIYFITTAPTGGNHIPAIGQAITASFCERVTSNFQANGQAYIDNGRVLFDDEQLAEPIILGIVNLARRYHLLLDSDETQLRTQFERTRIGVPYEFLGLMYCHSPPSCWISVRTEEKLRQARVCLGKEGLTMEEARSIFSLCIVVSNKLDYPRLCDAYYVLKFMRKRTSETARLKINFNEAEARVAKIWPCALKPWIKWIDDLVSHVFYPVADNMKKICNIFLFSDSSLGGYGWVVVCAGTCRGHGARWPQHMQKWPICDLESLAFLRAVKAVLKDLPSVSEDVRFVLHAFIDNTTLLGAVHKRRSVRYHINEVMRVLQDDLHQSTATLGSCQYIRSEDNISDGPSRGQVDQKELERWYREEFPSLEAMTTTSYDQDHDGWW